MAEKFKADENTVITFFGKTYNVQQFADAFSGGDTINAIGAMTVLLNDGRAKIYQGNQSKEAKAFERTYKEQAVKDAAAEHENYEEMNKDYRADQKREGRLTYPCVEYEFAYPLKAQEFENYVKKDLRIYDTELSVRNGKCSLKVYNVTDAEVNAMSRTYKADKFAQATVGVVDTTVGHATDAIHYGATRIVSPVIQVGVRAGASIFKTILTTTAKTAGTLVSATTQGVKSATYEIKHDPEVLKGSRDLLDAGDAIRRKVGICNNGGAGITIHQEQ
jgi:hypothetical protein